MACSILCRQNVPELTACACVEGSTQRAASAAAAHDSTGRRRLLADVSRFVEHAGPLPATLLGSLTPCRFPGSASLPGCGLHRGLLGTGSPTNEADSGSMKRAVDTVRKSLSRAAVSGALHKRMSPYCCTTRTTVNTAVIGTATTSDSCARQTQVAFRSLATSMLLMADAHVVAWSCENRST